MNMREIVIDRIRLNENMLETKPTNNLKELGFIDYKRTIQLFIKEIERINGIPDRKVQEIAALITNYSIVDIDRDSRMFNKTVYFCDVEFPKDLNMEAIVKNIEPFIEIAYIRPTYAFQTSHVTRPNGYVDLGLSMCDLSVSGSCGIINFADNKGEFPKFKDQIYSNSFNPKFYNSIDARLDMQKQRSGNINEFVDNRTTIFCNTYGSTSVENFINNEVKTGIYINNRTRALNDFINDVFQKLLHIGLEKIEIVMKKVNKHLEFNVTKCGFFAKFNDDVKHNFIEEILYNCEKQAEIINAKIDEDFYLVYSFDTKFAILDYLYNEGGNEREIRITKPIYHLYNEFSIDTEDIMNNVELNGEMSKFDMIETVEKEAVLNLGCSNKDIKDMIDVITNATNTVLAQIENSNSDRARLSMDDKLWQRNLLEQKK